MRPTRFAYQLLLQTARRGRSRSSHSVRWSMLVCCCQPRSQRAAQSDPQPFSPSCARVGRRESAQSRSCARGRKPSAQSLAPRRRRESSSCTFCPEEQRLSTRRRRRRTRELPSAPTARDARTHSREGRCWPFGTPLPSILVSQFPCRREGCRRGAPRSRNSARVGHKCCTCTCRALWPLW